MKILVGGFGKYLSDDNYLKHFFELALLELLVTDESNSVFYTDAENISIEHERLIPIVLEMPFYKSLFKKAIEKHRINNVIEAEKIDVLFSIAKPISPKNIKEYIINTRKAKLVGPNVGYLTEGPSAKLLSLMPGIFYRELEWEEREDIKNRYTNGREYFYCSLYNTTIAQLTTVLKGFSAFKKWQNSNMCVVLGEVGPQSEVQELLAHYKYKDDVICLPATDLHTDTLVVGAAFAVLYFPEEDLTGLRVVNYLKAGLPVISYEMPPIKMLTEDAVLYAAKSEIESIADQMKRIYKDEKVRSLLKIAAEKVFDKQSKRLTLSEFLSS